MKKIKLLKVVGVVIMLSAFLIVPDSEPWYNEILIFNLGMALSYIPKRLMCTDT